MRIASLRRHATGQWLVKLGGKCHYLGKDRDKAQAAYRELIVEHYGPSKVAPSAQSAVSVTSLMNQFVKTRLAECSEQWLRV